METKHTPGPWCYQLGAIVDNEGYLIADVRSRWDDGQDGEDYHFANARLIASAPELLQALEYIATGGENWKDCARVARAAIAKAKGE